MVDKRNKCCPNCQERISDNSALFRCGCCYTVVCGKCSTNKLCLDCYVSNNVIDERDIYFSEKYGVVN